MKRTSFSQTQKKALKVIKEIGILKNQLYQIKYGSSEDDRYLRKKSYKDFFSEFTESFICELLKLKKAPKGTKGYDATKKQGGKTLRYQIKEITRSHPFFLGKKLNFDILITIQLNPDNYELLKICRYPKKYVKDHLYESGSFNSDKHGDIQFVLYNKEK